MTRRHRKSREITPIVETVCKNYKEITGRDPQISGRQGAADTRFLNLLCRHPNRDLRPGFDRGHACQRRVRVRSTTIITSIKVMALSICDWCGVEGQEA